MDKILVIDMCGEKNSLHFDEFVNPVIEVLENIKTDFEIRHYREVELSFMKKFKKVIMCGVALKDFKYLEDIEIFNWVKEFENYILGICAGAQVIGKIFEAEIKDGLEIGLVDIEKIKKDKILDNVNLQEIYSLHSLFSEVPKGFDLILRNNYPQLFTNGKIYACLFHPEVRNKKIIENFAYFSPSIQY